jgi:hypothetical protein
VVTLWRNATLVAVLPLQAHGVRLPGCGCAFSNLPKSKARSTTCCCQATSTALAS